MKKGFTLIELLVVITILAVLTGAALPYIQGYVEDSRIAKVKADLDEISRALAVYEMREGPYNSPDIKLLTGRYLNKSSVDPWGGVYSVATISGNVYSYGPDKTPGNDDDIKVPYQPPLALVSAKWVDRNQSGSVDEQLPADQVILNFSREFHISLDDTDITTAGAPAPAPGTGMNKYFITSANTDFSVPFKIASSKFLSNRKGIVLEVQAAGVFGIKSDTITVKSLHSELIDLDSVQCLSSQPVVIIPQ